MMNSLTQKLVLALCVSLIGAAPAFARGDKTTGAKTTGAKTMDKTMGAAPYATLHFQPGSAVLSQADKTTLSNLVSRAKSNRKIDEVTVAAWSDRAFPRGNTKLSDADQDLAERRADAIEEYLDDQLKVGDVDTYNMAESSNWMARTFNTQEAELKSLFARQGSRTPVTDAEFQIIKREGGPSQAVVVIEHED